MSDKNHDIIEILITKELANSYKRLDQLLAALTPYSRTFLKGLFEEDLIISHEETPYEQLSLKKMPPSGTIVQILIPPPIPLEAEAEDLPLEILYEDEDLLFVNKGAGMVVHPAPGNYTGTLVNALLHHCPDLKGIGGVKRPGIVHRLDKGTSGVMVVAKSQKAHEKLILTFSKHDLVRKYECLTYPKEIPQEGTLISTIGRHPKQRQKMAANVHQGKEAITHYKVLQQEKYFNHIELTLETGRTHQIRVHLSSLLNCPILMDSTYGNPSHHLKIMPEEIKVILKDYPYPLLHAKVLELQHPITGKLLHFESPLPEIMKNCLNLKC